jgi:hypothetical protein
MAYIYDNIFDTINHRTFPATIPEYYEPDIPEFFKVHGTQPIFAGGKNDCDWCQTRLSVATVVDLCYNKVPFNITKSEDNLLIYRILDDYVAMMRPQLARPDAGCNEDAKVFFAKALVAHARFKKFHDQLSRYIQNTSPNPKRKPTLSEMMAKLGH